MNAPSFEHLPARAMNRFLTGAALLGLRLTAAIVLLSSSGSAARADQVVVGDAHFGRVRITGFEGGRLFFVAGDGVEHSAWIDEIERIAVDTASGFEDFNEAELAFAEGDRDRAIGRYERALRRSRNHWQSVISCRLASVYLADGRLDRGVGYFVSIARDDVSGPRAAARLLPSEITVNDRPAATRAVQQLDSALRGARDDSATTVIRLLRFAIAQRIGRSGGEREARAVLSAPLDATIGTSAAYDIRLSAAESLLEGGAISSGDLERIDEMIEHAPSGVLAGFLLVKGRARMRAATKRDDVIRAIWPLMRIVIHLQDDPLAPAALLEAGRGMERLDSPGKALSLWRECLDLPQSDEAMKKTVESEIARVAAAPGKTN